MTGILKTHPSKLTQGPTTLLLIIDLTADTETNTRVNILEWPLPTDYQVTEIDLSNPRSKPKPFAMKIWMKKFIDSKSKSNINRHTLFINGVKQNPFSCITGSVGREPEPNDTPTSENQKKDNKAEHWPNSLSDFDYEVKEMDWLIEKPITKKPPTQEKRLTAEEKSKNFSNPNNWKLYVEIKRKLEAHKLVSLDFEASYNLLSYGRLVG